MKRPIEMRSSKIRALLKSRDNPRDLQAPTLVLDQSVGPNDMFCQLQKAIAIAVAAATSACRLLNVTNPNVAASPNGAAAVLWKKHPSHLAPVFIGDAATEISVWCWYGLPSAFQALNRHLLHVGVQCVAAQDGRRSTGQCSRVGMSRLGQ